MTSLIYNSKYLFLYVVYFFLVSCSCNKNINHSVKNNFDNKHFITEIKWTTRIEKNSYISLLYDYHLYSSSKSGIIKKIDLSSGKTCFKKNIKNNLSSGIVCCEGNMFSTSDNNILLLDHDGNITSEIPIKCSCTTSPSIYKNTIIIVKTDNNKLKAFSLVDNKILWNIYAPKPQYNIITEKSLLLYDNLVIFGLAKRRIVALNIEDGSTHWSYDLPNRNGVDYIERINDIYSMQIINNALYAISSNGDLFCFDIRKQFKIKWSQLLNIKIRNLIVDDNFVYTIDENSIIRCFDCNNGNILWTNKSFNKQYITNPISIKNFFVIADIRGNINLICKETGWLSGYFNVSHCKISYLTGYRDCIIAQSDNGKLTSIEVK